MRKELKDMGLAGDRDPVVMTGGGSNGDETGPGELGAGADVSL